MILDLPYSYDFSCVPPGCVSIRRYEVRGTAPFEIPSVRDAEAPVSCTFEETAYRSFEGRCYRRLPLALCELEGRLTDVHKHYYGRDPGAPASLVGHLFSRRPTTMVSPFGRPTEDTQVADLVASAKRGGAVKDRSSDATQAVSVAATLWTNGLLVVEGEPWVACPEPRYCLERQGRGYAVTARAEPFKEATWSLGFRADRLAEAVAYAKTLSKRPGSFLFDGTKWTRIDVASEDLLTYDEADGLASAILDEMGDALWWNADGRSLQQSIEGKRRAGDASWARDLLGYPRLREMTANGGGQNYAEERRKYGKACAAALDAWRDVFEAADRGPYQEEDEEYLAAMGGP